jgi:hypothetical protein
MAKQQVRKKTPTPSTEPAAAPVPAQTTAADVTRPPRTRATTKKAAGTTADAPVEPAAPSFDQIAQRAYLRFVERGGTPGHELEDWLAAESELKSLVRR